MIFDTHAHYDDAVFDEDRLDLLDLLPKRGIKRVVNVGSDIASSRMTLALTFRYNYIYGALGIHPDCVDGLTDMDWLWLDESLNTPTIVAVGEIGFDYHTTPRAEARQPQEEAFTRQLTLARAHGLPVIIHSREAAEDTMRVLETCAQGIGGVMHCFSYGVDIARTVLDMGFYIGVGGVATFKNSKKLREVIEETPLERIVIETDCPYLAPEPHRGTRNSSLNLPLVIEAVAAIKNTTPQIIEEATYRNACEMYGIKT